MSKKIWAKLWAIRNWTAIGAIATAFAVIWAIYSQGIINFFNRPNLEIAFFEPLPPHLFNTFDISVEEGGESKYNGLIITLQLKNNGKSVAYQAQPYLTNLYYKDNTRSWKPKNGWIQIPLKWVLGEDIFPSLIRDLIPEKPYLFNLGSFSSIRDGKFLFTYSKSPLSQKETVDPGEYCFEVTVFALKAKPIKKYLYVDFDDFSGVTDLEKIKGYIKKVEMKDHPPS